MPGNRVQHGDPNKYVARKLNQNYILREGIDLKTRQPAPGNVEKNATGKTVKVWNERQRIVARYYKKGKPELSASKYISIYMYKLNLWKFISVSLRGTCTWLSIKQEQDQSNENSIFREVSKM